jgi:DDE superfamily endonuclease
MPRFTRTQIYDILPYLQLDAVEYRFRNKPSNELAISIVLARLSYPRKGQDLSGIFGRSAAYISAVFNDVVEYLFLRYKGIIEWHPTITYERCRFFAAKLEHQSRTKTPGIWGFLDGTFRVICRPTTGQRIFYSGYKKKHGFKYQALVTPDGILSSLMGPFEGRINDNNMYSQSGLESRLHQLFDGREPLFIFGDSQYDSCFGVLSPYKRFTELSANQKRFNAELAWSRISVEQAFGRVQNIFSANAFELQVKIHLQQVACFFVASALFTNIQTCMEGNQVGRRFQVSPPSLHQYLSPRRNNNDNGDLT